MEKFGENNMSGYVQASAADTAKQYLQNDCNAQSMSEASVFDEEDDDGVAGLPVFSQHQVETMLYGVIGQVAKAGAAGKGLNPVAIALATMVWLSSAVSPRITLAVGDTKHPARIFGVHVGRSATGGKGDSINLLNKIRKYLDARYPNLTPMFHSGGLSTREGLALKVHDGYEDKGRTIDPVADKRLMVLESEFVKLLKLGKSDNPILAVIRELWDFGGSIQPLTKTAPIRATNPHITIYGNVTPDELKSTINLTEIYGGTVNRFLFIFAERLQMVPFPPETPDSIVVDYAERFADIILWAKENYGSDQDDHQTKDVTLSAEAMSLWEKEYDRLARPYGSSVVVDATNRRAPYALRIALLFAITDKTHTIEVRHLKSAIAWVDASAQTAGFLFGTTDRKAKVNLQHKAKLITFLKNQDGQEASRTDISKKCFSGKLKIYELDNLLNGLNGGIIEKRQIILQNKSKKTTYKLVS